MCVYRRAASIANIALYVFLQSLMEQSDKQAAILRETGADAPDNASRQQLLEILHSARDPRKKSRRDRVGEEGENRDGGQNRVGTERSTKGNIAWKNFETYYRTQLPLPPHELDLFLKCLRTPLPVTFRLVLPSGGSEANSQAVSAFEKRVYDALAAGAGRILPL